MGTTAPNEGQFAEIDDILPWASCLTNKPPISLVRFAIKVCSLLEEPVSLLLEGQAAVLYILVS